MVLMEHLFSKIRKCNDHIIFQYYELDVICAQYSHLVIVARLQLKLVKTRKKTKNHQWKLSIEDHNAILKKIGH